MFKFFRKLTGTSATPYLPVPTNGQPSVLSETESARCKSILLGLSASETFAEPDGEEHELWRTGKLVPWYITCLLDSGHHYGPQVDTACHAAEPAVDNWELGRLYPNWDQTVALARLLNVRVRDLAHPEARPRHQPERPVRRPGRHIAILSFEPSAVHLATS